MIKVKDTTSISSNDYYAHFSPGIASTATDLSIITGTNSSNYDSNLGTITGSITGTTTSTSIHAKTTPNPIGLLESASLAMLNTEKSSSLTQRDDGTFASSDEWGTTTIYADESATELLGYETNYGWGSNHYFSEYDANWQPQKSIYTEGSRTTEYATIEGVWTLVKLTVDYSKMTASTENDYTLYSEQDAYGNTLTYYKITATDTLEHYTTTYENNYTYNDWLTGKEIENKYSGTTTYNTKGEITYANSSYQYGNYVSSDEWVYSYTDEGKLASISNNSYWKEGNTSSKTTTSYNASWQSLVSKSITTTTYIDATGVEQFTQSQSTTEYEYNDEGNMIAYTVTTTDEKGTTTERIDVNDMIYPYYKLEDVTGAKETFADTMLAMSSDMPVIATLADKEGHEQKAYIANNNNNLLSGTEGEDHLFGKAGDDIYRVNSKQDKVYETNSLTDSIDMGGIDTVESTVSYSLGSFVENLSLVGTNNIHATGNSLDNQLKGNIANNQLKGGKGDDWLNGGLGKDTLTGGSGADSFVFDTSSAKKNVDTITDFSIEQDKIVLDCDVFNALSASGLTSSELLISKKATQAQTEDQHIIYNTKTGALYYDADGAGDESSIKIAILGVKGHPNSLSLDNFSVI